MIRSAPTLAPAPAEWEEMDSAAVISHRANKWRDVRQLRELSASNMDMDASGSSSSGAVGEREWTGAQGGGGWGLVARDEMLG